MHAPSSKTLLALAAAAALGGCATETQLDRQFGMAAKSTMRQQYLNPNPPVTTAVTGMDGPAAKSAYDNYQKSFKEPVPQAGALAIGVGR